MLGSLIDGLCGRPNPQRNAEKRLTLHLKKPCYLGQSLFLQANYLEHGGRQLRQSYNCRKEQGVNSPGKFTRASFMMVCNADGSVCPMSSICLEQVCQMDIVHGLSCGHVFHNKCLEQWVHYSAQRNAVHLFKFNKSGFGLYMILGSADQQ